MVININKYVRACIYLIFFAFASYIFTYIDKISGSTVIRFRSVGSFGQQWVFMGHRKVIEMKIPTGILPFI